MAGQLIQIATVHQPVPGWYGFYVMTHQGYVFTAYYPDDKEVPQAGQLYTVSKINSTYYIGQRIVRP
jgi:hypothetical protein